MNAAWFFMAAGLLDWLLGDPAFQWHPVRLIGRGIAWSEGLARRKGGHLKRRGIGLCLCVVSLTWLAALALLEVLAWMDGRLGARGWLFLLGAAVLLKFSFAIRDLVDHAQAVFAALRDDDLQRARVAVGRMVGRDVTTLDERGVRRACLESVAESLGDGVVAPLFYAMLGGPALALAYRAINTLDSMVGYKNEAYIDLGWASAKLDDAANYLPARFSAGLVAAAAWVLRLDASAALRVARMEAPLQPSPNAGWPEGAFAGALGVQFGGELSYQGRRVQKATLGVPLNPLNDGACRMGLRLYRVSGYLALILAAAGAVVLTELPRRLAP
jgi:adenosylcobinamide-phosphate synthase